MASSYPTSLDSFATLVDNVDGIVAAHPNDRGDAIENLQAKVGINSSAVTTSHDYLLTHLPAQAGNWDAGGYEIRALKLQSDVATGTAPLTIASTTVCTNLNADTVDGKHVAGTNGAGEITTNDGSQTLTNKTLTSPDINGGTVDGVTIGASSAPTVTNLGAVATCDINGGTIDGVTIGAAAAPTVTNLGSVATCDINGGTVNGISSLSCSAGASINEISTDGTLAGNSDTAVPTEKAVKTYVDALPTPGANYQAFTSNGTWVKPASGNMVIIEAWGGGGGGGNSMSETSSAAGGGGGGGYSRRVLPLSAIAGNVTVVVGAGGVRGVSANAVGASGNTGGISTFGTHLTAFGGGAGISVGSNRAGGGGGGEGANGGAAQTTGINTGGWVGGGYGGSSNNNDSVAAGGDALTIYGGGGGGGVGTVNMNVPKNGGRAVYGGGGGASGCGNNGVTGAGGASVFGGNGGRNNTAPIIPAGGGAGGNGANGNGARGEVRVWVV